MFSVVVLACRFSFWEKILILFKSRSAGKYYSEIDIGSEPDYRISPAERFSPFVSWNDGEIIAVKIEQNDKIRYFINDKEFKG